MDIHEQYESLQPRGKSRVYDLLVGLGMDVTHWGVKEGKVRDNPATNTAYNDRWAYYDESTGVALLNLWHRNMACSGDEIVYRESFTEKATRYRAMGENYRDLRGKYREQAKSLQARGRDWAEKAMELNSILFKCFNGAGTFHVAIIAGDQTDGNEADSVKARELDSVLWHIKDFDQATLTWTLARGPKPSSHLVEEALPAITEQSYGIEIDDQFIVDLEDAPAQRVEKTAMVYERDPECRRQVLIRSKGNCESCSEPGFLKANGHRYLETHHIVAVSEGGHDHPSNMIALCPNEHREAHYGANKDELKAKYLSIVAALQ
ncbi:hypothetical protein HNP46_000011 [Pseudomonas nitritireducens]|uniref:HNH nuclease domain-containing protein n=1 Tax=Pseudomonas nitroreducens TaxID=46680 RepID=A0A7W7NZE3_PSENT|nr:HNH endonuclease [Pseudomonas nitritireducens]MBB4861200.1 hypothetical protein [Pseudomonas nitritireducens]